MVAVGTVIGVVAPSAFAGITATLYANTGGSNDGQPSGYRDTSTVGGEFTAVLSGNSVLDNTILSGYSQSAKVSVNGQAGFETFCVENNVDFKPGTSYSATLNQSITPGATGAINTLTQGVAWLYKEFATGALQDYNYTVGTSREASATALQDAIWYLQGETKSEGTGDEFVQLADTALHGASNAEEATTAAGASNFGVDVLDLTTLNGQPCYAQDQLVYCPVPEPSTIAAGAMLLLPLGWTTHRALRSRKSGR